MRTEEEILQKIKFYQDQLRELVAKPNQFFEEIEGMDQGELLVFAVVDKIEILLWVLELETAQSNILNSLGDIKH